MPLDDMPTVDDGDTTSSDAHNTLVANTQQLDERLSAQGGSDSRIYLRAVRRTPGSATRESSTFQPVWWTGDVDAHGLAMIGTNNTGVRLSTPGMYLVTATITLSGKVSSGTRLMLYLSDADIAVNYAASNYPLPATTPQVQATGLVPVFDDPAEVWVWLWSNSTATTNLDVSGVGNMFTVAYLGGV